MKTTLIIRNKEYEVFSSTPLSGTLTRRGEIMDETTNTISYTSEGVFEWNPISFSTIKK